MKKILLVGKFGEIISGINDCLEADFHIQLCAPVVADVRGMLKIVKPDMVLLCQDGDNISLESVCNLLDEFWSYIPVLIVCTKDEWKEIRMFLDGSQYEKIFRPVAKADLIAKCKQILNITDPIAEPDRKQILVVDDSAMVLRNIKGMLEEKFDVILATSGERALKVVQERPVDLIFLDYEMPGMDGKETFDEILQTENGINIPVVFLTSVSDRSRIMNVLKCHPAGYVLKPPDKEKIMGVIKDVLGEDN